jgi:hypothetical protein
MKEEKFCQPVETGRSGYLVTDTRAGTCTLVSNGVTLCNIGGRTHRKLWCHILSFAQWLAPWPFPPSVPETKWVRNENF